MSASASASERDRSPAQDITMLMGRDVYSNNGVFVGQVEDVRLDLDAEAVTGLALSALNDNLFADLATGEQGVIVPYRWVRAVGDVILVHDLIERPKRSDEDG